jgi:signal transduction histidine kinase
VLLAFSQSRGFYEGKGISPEKMSQISSVGAAGAGLRGMQERIKDFGGDLEVISYGKGSTIRMVIPVAACENHYARVKYRENGMGSAD